LFTVFPPPAEAMFVADMNIEYLTVKKHYSTRAVPSTRVFE